MSVFDDDDTQAEGSIEDRFKERLGDLYDPTILDDYNRNTSNNGGGDPNDWFERIAAKNELRADNATNSEYVPDGKGGYMVGPGGAPSGGGSGGGGNRFGSPNYIQPFTETFTPPSIDDVKNSEPFKFKLGEAINAVSRAGLAKGSFGTNQTWKALEEQGAGIASDEFDKAYDRKMGEYLTKFNIFDRNESSRYGSQRNNMLDQYGMLDTDRKFDLTRDESVWGRGRADRNDTWARGGDLWSMNRTDREDDFNHSFSIADLISRYRPRPA